jgi:hypothetical protein
MPSKITWTDQELESLPKTIGEAININSNYFFTGKKCRKNHLAPRHSDSGKCVECRRETSRITATKYRIKNKSFDVEKLKITREFHGLSRSLEIKLYNTAKIRARKKNIEFTIKVTDIKIPELCPIFGIQLDNTWGGVNQNNKNRSNKPSLDRLDPRKGYTSDNIIVICYRANMIKGDGFPDEHRKIANFLINNGL